MALKNVAIFLMFILSACATVPKGQNIKDAKDKKMLKNVRVALLLTDGFEQVEMTEPRKALEAAGAEVTLIAPKEGRVQGFNHDKKADTFRVDLTLDKASAHDFDALLLPGGVKNPDSLRLVPAAIKFIQEMGKAKKPIAAICHGPWTLINAGLVRGLTMTSWPSLEIDLKNAGARWIDQAVVVDQNFVTSRKPEDIPAFNNAMIGLFAKSPRRTGIHEKQKQ